MLEFPHDDYCEKPAKCFCWNSRADVEAVIGRAERREDRLFIENEALKAQIGKVVTLA